MNEINSYIYTNQFEVRYTVDHDDEDLELCESLINVSWSIKNYEDCKKHCASCPHLKKYSERVCYDTHYCLYYIPDFIHLDIMLKRQAELIEECNIRFKVKSKY